MSVKSLYSAYVYFSCLNSRLSDIVYSIWTYLIRKYSFTNRDELDQHRVQYIDYHVHEMQLLKLQWYNY